MSVSASKNGFEMTFGMTGGRQFVKGCKLSVPGQWTSITKTSFTGCLRYPWKFTAMTIGRAKTRTVAEVSWGRDVVEVRWGSTNMYKMHQQTEFIGNPLLIGKP